MHHLGTLPASNVETYPDRSRTIESFFAAFQAGDSGALQAILSPDAVTRWPQSGERITGAMACLNVYANYPGGMPDYQIRRITGEGAVWVAELLARYGEEWWHTVSVIEFEGARIARMTDYFGPTLPAPDWRKNWVELDEPNG